jgi:hypothetical protein
MIIPSSVEDNNFTENFLILVLDNIREREISVVPTAPTIAKFIRKNRKYKRLLPVGIRI